MNLIGIQNVGEFYSHHYLDTLLEKDLKGLFERWRDEDESTPDRRLNRCAADFFTAKREALRERHLAGRYEPSHRLHVELLEALGYDYHFDLGYLLDGSAIPLLGAVQRDGQPYLWLVETVFAGEDESPLDQPVLAEQYQQVTDQVVVADRQGSRGAEEQGSHEARFPTPADLWSDLIGEVFRAPEPPRWLILLAGRFVYLLDRTKWGQGKYLLFDLDEIFGRRERETLRAAAALLARDALCPVDSVPLHDTLDENSHKHAYGVSTDLKYGLRQAVELLANEYVWYGRNVRKKELFGDDELGRKLTDESLTYLYRLLFLFYVEAHSLELETVPMNSEAYRTGYSLESLRDLEQVALTTPQAQNGYFLHDSLTRLFKLINEGYAPQQLQLRAGDSRPQGSTHNNPPTPYSLLPTPLFNDYGFDLRGLASPLFDAAATPLLSSVKFRNAVLQQVLQLLSLSREGRWGKNSRGRISYAQLGINQLGAVYEGLLSYSGFFAREDLYEVKPAGSKEGDETAQAYFIPHGDLGRYEPEEFVYVEGPDGRRVRKMYPRGSFIYRLAGRDREKSASYYTPEVLTQCLVKYSLKELLQGKSADDILTLTLCEPAMGSGAFINEALNQLADAYLERKQQELGQALPPDQYRDERQKVKAYLALHNSYGVDLKPLAVKLAQVSLWLNTLHRGQAAPWFSARLVVGNSLIGARRQVYQANDILSGAYQNQAPTPVPWGQPRPEGSVYHWLLPDAGMAAFDGDAVIKELAPAEVQAIKAWRKRFTAKISRAELKNLQTLSDRADTLWQQYLRERQAMLQATREPIGVWGQGPGAGGQTLALDPRPPAPLSIAAKEAALAQLHRPTGPYRRLKLALDYWCTLWFWPIPQAEQLPDRADFLADLADLLVGENDFEKAPEQLGLFEPPPTAKQAHLADITAPSVADLAAANPRLQAVVEVAERQRFHHWELAFAEVFAGRGGFDLVVGNPPWVKLEWHEGGLLSDYDPRLAIRKVSASDIVERRERILVELHCEKEFLEEFVEITGSKSFFNALNNYPFLKGIQSNLYKCFLTQSWSIGAKSGIMGLLHPETIFDDSKGGLLREQIYKRIKYQYRFVNVLKLFNDILHWVNYCICVYRTSETKPIQFVSMSNLFHPHTIESSELHDGEGVVPGIKNSTENWELRGHRNRLVTITEDKLDIFAKLYEPEDTSALQARFPVIHSTEVIEVLQRFTQQPFRLRDFPDQYYFTAMWHETNSQKDRIIHREIRYPQNLSEWIVSGPHFYVANPFNKNPNENCSNPLDYSEIDLLDISENYFPRTLYVPVDLKRYAKHIPIWQGKSITSFYRQFFRAMLASEGERTLIGCIMPKDVGHIHGVISFAFKDSSLLSQFSGLCSSILYDFFIKSVSKTNLHDLPTLLPLPLTPVSLDYYLQSRTLRLNCLTNHYAALWEELYNPAFNRDGWAKSDPRLKPWHDLTPHWQRHVALRTSFERRQALVEIDVLAALALNLTLDELLTIYRVQFPVLQKNERRLLFDQRGMEVPVKSAGGELIPNEADPQFAELVPPFTPVDREADYRQAWGYFEGKVGEG